MNLFNSTVEAIEFHQQACNETRKSLKEHDLLGPWMEEPDRVEFEAFGLPCLLIRNPMMFHWCGYVGVKLDHPAVKIEKGLQVHGGITYRNECDGYICHSSENEDNLFWLGFDCAHFQDFIPGIEARGLHSISKDMLKSLANLNVRSLQDYYRDLNFVMNETRSLAWQLS